MRKLFSVAIVLSLLFAGTAVAQQQIQVTVENLQSPDTGSGGGFYLTPVFVAAHDGNFDLFDPGSAASASLEALAEDGITSGVVSDFNTFTGNGGSGQQQVFLNPAGFGGAPVFDPGQSETRQFSLNASDRYLSYATMIIPSNDSFFANGDPLAVELLDASGVFTGDRVLEFSLENLWDAGTEVNNTEGAAFSANGGTGTTENGVVTLGPDISNFDGIGTPAGTTIDFDTASSSPVLRITISAVAVPEPSSASVLGLATLGCLLRRRRK